MIIENKSACEKDPKININAEKFKIADLLYKKKEDIRINGKQEGVDFLPAEKEEKNLGNDIEKEKQNETMGKLNKLLREENSERAPPLEIEESKIIE